jgi:thiol-disulfide isomerase/thioredoxin
MKHLINLFLLLLPGIGFPQSGNYNQAANATSVLEKTVRNLEKCTTIKYYYERDYFNGEHHQYTKGVSLIDFDAQDTLVRLKYRIISDNGFECFYNGTQTFQINKNEKNIVISNKPKNPNQLNGQSFFYNSIVSLRRTLPLIVKDNSIQKTIHDTLIEGKQYHIISFSLYKKTFEYFGGYWNISENGTFSFKLLISKSSFLPYMLLQSSNITEHTSKVTYSNIETDVKYDEASLFTSSYLDDYTDISNDKPHELLKIGQKMPVFTLPDFNSGSLFHSNKLSGKIVLLDFWIRNCGPCIASVPKLNELYKKYKDRGIEIIGINAHDEKQTVGYFVKKYGPVYPILPEGENISKIFGVNAFPTIFIFNTSGEVIYSGGFDEKAITELLGKNKGK